MSMTESEWEELRECCTDSLYQSVLDTIEEKNAELERLRAVADRADVGAVREVITKMKDLAHRLHRSHNMGRTYVVGSIANLAGQLETAIAIGAAVGTGQTLPEKSAVSSKV